MAYEKTNWQTGDTVTAEKLNHAENGIAAAYADMVIKSDIPLYNATVEDLAITQGNIEGCEEIINNGGVPKIILYSVYNGEPDYPKNMYDSLVAYAMNINYRTIHFLGIDSVGDVKKCTLTYASNYEYFSDINLLDL